MTNYGVLAILALPQELVGKFSPDIGLLLALETHKPSSDGTRLVGLRRLAEEAGLPINTARRARDRLVKANLILYEAGSGAGRLSAWRILFSLERVPLIGGTLSGDDPESKRVPSRPEKGPKPAKKGSHQNAVTCGNDSASLQDSVLQDSVLLKALFEEFIQAYPRPGERRWSWPAWETAIASGADPAVLVDAARRYAKAGEPLQHIPYPKKWLSERRWRDWDIEAVKASPYDSTT